MSHYRTIEVEGFKYRYVIGRWATKIDDVGVFDNFIIGHCIDEDRVSVTPGHIEKVIRRERKIPQREYDWDVPKTKVDAGPRTRGFRALIGVKIVDIRVSAINEVILEGKNGDRYAIETESSGPLGLSVIKCRQLAGNEAEST